MDQQSMGTPKARNGKEKCGRGAFDPKDSNNSKQRQLQQRAKERYFECCAQGGLCFDETWTTDDDDMQ